jgi:predicted membrane protein
VTVDALRAIKHCALAIIGFVAVGVVFIIIFGDKDDRPAGVFMSFLVTFASSVIATAAAMFARSLQNSLRRSEGSRVEPAR